MNLPGRSSTHSITKRNCIRLRGPRAILLAATCCAAIAGTGLQGATQSSAGSALPGAAKQLVETTCAGCHSFALATSRGRTPGEWNDIVQQMIGLGAPLGPEQAQTATEYLAATCAGSSNRSPIEVFGLSS
tara:strand:- start:46412 stop:46804 length:393 start_codon:yes stop_codon:yes gene_type:complete